MKYRLMAGLIGIVGVAAFWLVPSRQVREVGVQLIPETPQPSVQVPPDRRRSPRSKGLNSETTQETTPGVFPQESVPTPAKPASLAALAEPPDGPEIAQGLKPMTVLENMRSVFRQYSLRFGGNPTGINREITTALNGGNPRQVVFLDPEDGIRVNSRGELVDNWGTPYFFHQLSRTEMEIHSAGPDLKMWTEDDLVIK